MVKKPGISNDWLEKFRSDYKQMFEYIDSNAPEKIFDKLIVTDEAVSEVKRGFVDSLISYYNLGDDVEKSKVFRKFDYLLEVAERFEDRYDFFGFVYLFNRVIDEVKFSKAFRDDKTISTPEILKSLKEILSFYDEKVALKLIGLFTRAEGSLHNRIYQFSKVLTDIVNNKTLSTHPLTSWIHTPPKMTYRAIDLKINFDLKDKIFKVVKHKGDVSHGNEITAFEKFLIFKFDDKLEVLDFIDKINPGDVKLVKVYAHIMEMKLLSHRFDDNFDLKPLLEDLFLKNQNIWCSEIRRHSKIIVETIVSECLKGNSKFLNDFIKNQVEINTIPKYPELMYLFEDDD